MTMLAAFCLLPAAFLVAPVVLLPRAGAAQALPTEKQELSNEQRGDIFMARKMYREAIDLYRKALPEGKDSFVQNKIGIAYQQMQDFRAAKRSYERAMKLNPLYAEARNNLGTLYHGQKNFRAAIREYQRALKLNPDSATFYSNLGTAYFARKRYDDAVKAWQRALTLDPEVFERRSLGGTVLQERSVQERSMFYYSIAKIHAQAGDVERALLNIRRALEEGFKERKRFLEEPEFKVLQELQAFKDLMAKEFRVL
jgi:tetratricopeptide (TPR) repeat protein